jgi:hypothetical protein
MDVFVITKNVQLGCFFVLRKQSFRYICKSITKIYGLEN